MRIKQSRIFPYPVYSEERLDYKNGMSLDAEIEYDNEIATILLSIVVSDENIRTLIHVKKVNLYCHVECSTTKYRELFKIDFDANKSKYYLTIPLYQLNDNVELMIALVANENIQNFNSRNLDEFYKDETIRFPQFATIGYSSTIELLITKKIDVNGDVPSIFTINPSDNSNIMICDYTGEQIVISLPREEYNAYFSMRGVYRRIKQMMLVFPALISVLDGVKSDQEEFEEKSWYIVLDNAYKRIGFGDGLSDALNAKSTVELAQLILGDLLKDAFAELSTVNNE